ncbi:hypothetical protein NDU88_008030 [Pleurodeles waltl]|uniref:Uncharacterized protein n=1 Tax=Pleurodeles waltl TaxID=8319 RepID=A0AAV7VW30_PLEWA|nr:hypothetical protein NDU88_008030 [Pleurodeles waltl]
MTRHRIAPQDREGCEGCRLVVRSASAASYAPCLAPCCLVIPLQARSPSGTGGGGCGGGGGNAGGATNLRVRRIAASAVITPPCRPATDWRIGAAFWRYATSHCASRSKERGSQPSDPRTNWLMYQIVFLTL